MISYTVGAHASEAQYIRFEASFPTHGQEVMQLQLPAWRPGRYELGNFAKNVRDWELTDDNGKALSHKKVSKDCWEFETRGSETIKISYSYFSVDLNAGSTYVDHDLLYFNPVNCFFYDPNHQNEQYSLKIDIPDEWKVATGLQRDGDRWLADDVQQIMDCPVVCSPTLKHFQYEEEGALFHVHYYGNPALKVESWKKDFADFTKSQLAAFKEIPCSDYHFLLLFHPYLAYHGVEHWNSTVVSIGPEQGMKERKGYRELLGVSCHELYHTWNIKSIRPHEMMPYDFARENYSELGFVAEGVTTYFGDQFLHRSKVFSDEEYFDELSKLIQRHRDNEGRHHYSVAESSWDTWLDGYIAGANGRKVSIYTEGALIALVCDIKILSETNGQKSLDDAMRLMYERFGKRQLGYNEADYKSILEEVSSTSFDEIFEMLVHGRNDYLDYVEPALDRVGLEIVNTKAKTFLESRLGVRTELAKESLRVTSVAPQSPASTIGLQKGDAIVLLDEGVPVPDFKSDKNAAAVEWKRRGQVHKASVNISEDKFFPVYQVIKKAEPSENQRSMYDFWKNR